MGKVSSANFAHMPLIERATMTPLLAQRLEKFNIALPRNRPIYDRIFVYPLEGADENEKFEGSVIYKSEVTKSKFNSQRGLLIKAGLGALQHLWSHGVELGHIVLTARLSPWERSYEGKGKVHKVLLLRSSEVVGSDDLETDVLGGHIGITMAADGELQFDDRQRSDADGGDEGI